MAELTNLKTAVSRHDVARILGFKLKALTYILYKKADATKYHQFEIPKRSGGTRTINAPYPDLMNLQKQLSDLLQDCIEEINKSRNIKTTLSHGFRRKHSIITNAAVHRNKRYVFNVDLEDFFGTINFGRVRGFFINNRNFGLEPAVATVLAQIACHDNALPQGSPCSPVISNLIGHPMDVRLAELAYQTGCHYSRYADDLTFSTNKPVFPAEVAKPVKGEEYQWQEGKELERIITRSGFAINAAKTRMQLKNSRQDVTGLVVNAKVNIRAEYRRTARAMVHRLLESGNFFRTETTRDEDGNPVVTQVDGTLDQLNGILSFIDTVSVFNRELRQKDLNAKERERLQKKKRKNLDSNEEVYRRFLFFRDFYAPSEPVIVCEGPTDNIYLKAAIQRLTDNYPQLAERNDNGGANLKVRIYRYTKTTRQLLNLAGGTGDLGKFVVKYAWECKMIDAPGMQQPVILLVDNDEGAKGKGGIYNFMKVVLGEKPEGKEPFYYLNNNLYVVPTPLTDDDKETMIEDFFDPVVLKTKLSGKSFNQNSKKGFDNKTEYGKHWFAKKVVNKNKTKLNFDGFKPILDNILLVLDEHRKIAAP